MVDRYGKNHRLSRLFKSDNGKILIMAMDHGIPYGEVEGLEDIESLLKTASGGVDAVILNRGMIDTLDSSLLNKFSLIYKLNGVTSYAPNPFDLVMFTSVEEALSYDPVALSYEFYIGGEHENRKLSELSQVLMDARKYDMPVISHIYPNEEKKDPKMISHCIRLGWELGTDIIKTFYYPGMSEQVSRTKKPVLIAGGGKMNNMDEVVKYVQSAMDEGVKGIAMGRNFWGWKSGTRSLVERLDKVVHGESSME